jgi:hypothetical protein
MRRRLGRGVDGCWGCEGLEGLGCIDGWGLRLLWEFAYGSMAL